MQNTYLQLLQYYEFDLSNNVIVLLVSIVVIEINRRHYFWNSYVFMVFLRVDTRRHIILLWDYICRYSSFRQRLAVSIIHILMYLFRVVIQRIFIKQLSLPWNFHGISGVGIMFETKTRTEQKLCIFSNNFT